MRVVSITSTSYICIYNSMYLNFYIRIIKDGQTYVKRIIKTHLLLLHKPTHTVYKNDLPQKEERN
jgi:hypothetical protein